MEGQSNQTVSFQGAQDEPAKPLPQPTPQPVAQPGAEGEKGAEGEITQEGAQPDAVIQEIAKQVQAHTDRLTAHIDKRLDEISQKFQPIASGNPAQQQGGQINSSEAESRAAMAAELVTQMGMDVMKEVGVEVLTTDQEATNLDMSSPSAYLKTLREAAEKKKQRLNTPSAGRLAGVPGGSYESENVDVMADELSKLQANPLANREKRKELRERLAKDTPRQ